MLRTLSIIIFSLILISCVKDIRVENIPAPMYGQPELEIPDILKKANQKFINSVKSEYGDLNKASSFWYSKADEYFNKKNFDYAMRRYNQSWLLNPNNYEPYWGFGRVMLELNKANESIKYFKKSLELIDDDFQKVALLADYGTSLSVVAKNTKDKFKQNKLYRLAEFNFIESTQLDPKYGRTWAQWSVSLFQEGKYKESREKHIKAKSLGVSFPMLEKWHQSK